MANGTNGNGNIKVYVWAGVILMVAFLAAIVGLAAVGVDVTPFVTGLAGLLGALVIAIPSILAYFQAKAARQENAQTNVKLTGVEKKVDGMTERYTEAKVGEATAVATLEATAAAKVEAADLAVITDAQLAEAIATPAPGATTAPSVTTTGGALDVNVINEAPVEVDVVEKKETKP